MKAPSKYKAVATKELKTRPTAPLATSEKAKVNATLNKLVELIKLKHT